jgi:hypothetical protein
MTSKQRLKILFCVLYLTVIFIIIICSYDLWVFNKSTHQFKPRLQTLKHVIMSFTQWSKLSSKFCCEYEGVSTISIALCVEHFEARKGKVPGGERDTLFQRRSFILLDVSQILLMRKAYRFWGWNGKQWLQRRFSKLNVLSDGEFHFLKHNWWYNSGLDYRN